MGPASTRVALAPLATTTSLLLEAIGLPRGSARSWYGPVRAALLADDRALLGPLFGADTPRSVPDCLVPEPTQFAPRFEDELERVVSTTPDDLVADLAANGLLGSPWSRAARAPRQWLDAYAACLRRAWSGLRPLWDRAQPLLEEEVDRVGRALARGTLDVLLGELSPRVTAVDGHWLIEPQQMVLTFGPRLLLMPMICGPRGLFLGDADGSIRDFCYPLPRARWIDGLPADAPRADSLRALLGAPRAELLRRLGRTTTAGSLAESMVYAPSAISYHLTSLERAGLVHRERSGRHVLVHRTARGRALLDLYDR